MNRAKIITEIETLKEEAIRKGFDYGNGALSAETTKTLKRFLGDIKHFINNEREYDLRHKKE